MEVIKKLILMVTFLLLLSKHGLSFSEEINDLHQMEREQDRDRRHVDNSMDCLNVLAEVIMILEQHISVYTRRVVKLIKISYLQVCILLHCKALMCNFLFYSWLYFIPLCHGIYI